jgi:hypothetical protein
MRARVLLVAAILLLAVSCSAGHGSESDRAIAIYSAAIRAVLAEPRIGASTTDAHRPVFVVAADKRTPVSLEVQAGIADALHTFATVQFVDHRAEAIDENNPLKRVHHDGILITLGQIPQGRNDVTINVQRYEQTGVSATEPVRLHRSGSTWAP